MTDAHIGAGLPPAEWPSPHDRAAFADAGDNAQKQLAWQREMERAQLSAWFTAARQARADVASAPSGEGNAERPQAAARHVRTGRGSPHQAAAAAAMPWPRADWPLLLPQLAAAGLYGMQPPSMPEHPGVSADAQPQGDAVPADEVPVTAHQGMRPPAPLAWLPPDAAMPSQAVHPASDTEPAAPETEAQAPLRIHEESMPSGQALWIAMRADDQALAALLPQLVLDLQRAQSRQGRQLYQVVCNGRLVWQDGRFTEGDSPHHPMYDPTGSKEIF